MGAVLFSARVLKLLYSAAAGAQRVFAIRKLPQRLKPPVISGIKCSAEALLHPKSKTNSIPSACALDYSNGVASRLGRESRFGFITVQADSRFLCACGASE
jgi:hypothetical protein